MEPLYPLDPGVMEEMPMPPAFGTEARGVITGRSRSHRVLRRRVVYLVGGTLVMDVVATVLMYLLEHDEAGSGFQTLGGALFWVTAQLTTVSSQEPNPLTALGQVIDIVLEVWSISVVATLAASVTAFLHARHFEDVTRHFHERRQSEEQAGGPPPA
jgi:hypothetical protein